MFIVLRSPAAGELSAGFHNYVVDAYIAAGIGSVQAFNR